jgi:hypothetical protein
MGLTGILEDIDERIARLQQIRTLLAGPTRRGPGRPKAVAGAEKPTGKTKSNVSPEGRARIVAAVKRRWAAHRKAAGK